MLSMFNGCSSLISIDLSNFNMSNCISYNDMFSNNNNIKYINIYNFKNDKIISKTFNNINNSIFICQKDKIIVNPKAYNCCDFNLKAYDCISSNNITDIPINTDYLNNVNNSNSIMTDYLKTDNNIINSINTTNTNNNIKSSSLISVGVIISIITGGILVIIIIMIIINCLFKEEHEISKNNKPKKKETKNSSSKVYSENEKKIDNSSRYNIFMPNNIALIKTKYKSPIFEYEPYNNKNNPMLIIFQNPRFGDSNILIDSNKTIDELIKFYFEISGRKDLYGDESIIFLIRDNSIAPPYPKENISTLKNEITKSGTIKIVVVDNDKKMNQ